jgi:hypothetical protein
VGIKFLLVWQVYAISGRRFDVVSPFSDQPGRSRPPTRTGYAFRRDYIMNVKTTATRAAATTLALGTVLGASTPALANHDRWCCPRDAVHAWTSSDNRNLSVADLLGDSHGVYGRMTRAGISGQPKLRNENGWGTTVTRGYGEVILSLQACVDKTTDSCSDWG